MKKTILSLIVFTISLTAFANDDHLATLIKRRDEVKSWAAICEEDGPYKNQFSSTEGKCAQGDLMIFGGFSGFSAQFAGDTEWSDARHLDQELSQGSNGRWWRGPRAVNNEDGNSFSRDQASGLMMYFVIGLEKIKTNPALKEKYKTKMQNWLTWIEKEGKGRMCKEGDQRCQINGLIGSIIYRMANHLGALDENIKKYKIVKKLKTMKMFNGGALAEIETAFTPPDYQMLLKIISLVNEYYLGDLKKGHLKRAAYWIYKKDPSNTLYRFFYQGIDDQLVKETLERCPSQMPSQSNTSYTIRHNTAPGDFQWKHPSNHRSWEIENGHGCLYLLNFMIADLKGNIPWLHNDAEPAELNFYCPFGMTQVGTQNMKGQTWPICRSPFESNTSRAKCLKTLQNVFDGEEKTCLNPSLGNWYLEQNVVRECPFTERFLGDIWTNAPVCYFPDPFRITKTKCDSLSASYKGYYFKSPIDGIEYCAMSRFGRFLGRKIKK